MRPKSSSRQAFNAALISSGESNPAALLLLSRLDRADYEVGLGPAVPDQPRIDGRERGPRPFRRVRLVLLQDHPEALGDCRPAHSVKRLAQLPGGCSVFDLDVTTAHALARCSSARGSNLTWPAPAARSPLARHRSTRAARPGRGCPAWSDRSRCGIGRSAAASRPRRRAGRSQGSRRTRPGVSFPAESSRGQRSVRRGDFRQARRATSAVPRVGQSADPSISERAQAVGNAGKQNMRVSAPERRPLNAAGPRFEPQRAHRAFEDHGRTARQRTPPTFLAFGASYEGAARFPISTWGRRPG